MTTKQMTAEKTEPKQDNAARRDQNIAKTEAQLKVWSTQLDDLVVGYLAAGAQAHDAYRLRVDALRARHGVVQTKLNEFNSPAGQGDVWGTFKASIADDWAALESGFKDLTR